jgi:hypothetical protein
MANSRCSRVDRSTSRRNWSSKWARRVQARGRVAQRLVGQLAAQQVVGPLLLFDLIQRGAQLRFALTLGALVRPDADQPAPAIRRGRTQHAQHGELAPHPGPFKAVFADQRRALGHRRLLGSAQGGGQPAFQQFGIGTSQHLGHGPLQEGGHRFVDKRVAAAGQVLHRQQVTPALHQSGQHTTQQGWQIQRRWGGWGKRIERHGLCRKQHRRETV